ncbi:MAG: hypothetical protein ACJAYY_001109 [Paraglaciecola sp.]|jgi:hypothetical protein
MKLIIFTIFILTIVLISSVEQNKATDLDCYPNSKRPAQAKT